MSLCPACQREIVYARTTRGRLIPIDREPADTGNVHLTQQDGVLHADVLHGAPLENAWRLGLVLHMLHQRTCTDPDRWGYR